MECHRHILHEILESFKLTVTYWMRNYEWDTSIIVLVFQLQTRSRQIWARKLLSRYIEDNIMEMKITQSICTWVDGVTQSFVKHNFIISPWRKRHKQLGSIFRNYFSSVFPSEVIDYLMKIRRENNFINIIIATYENRIVLGECNDCYSSGS